MPCMHVDIHGKLDPPRRARTSFKSYKLDLGADPLLECCDDPADTGAREMEWTGAEARDLVRLFTSENTAALRDVRIGRGSLARPVKVVSESYTTSYTKA